MWAQDTNLRSTGPRKGLHPMQARTLRVLNEDKEQCRKCGGACCKNAPGIFFPADLGQDKEEIISNLLEMFERREIYIASFFGGLVVRPGQKQQNIAGIGPCIWHTETGCSAPIKPTQCSALVPGGTWNNPPVVPLPSLQKKKL